MKLFNMILHKALEIQNFFSNFTHSQKEREQWIIESWLEFHYLDKQKISYPKQDPPDFYYDNIPVEIIEVLPKERKRGDEIKDWMSRIKNQEQSSIMTFPSEYSRLQNVKLTLLPRLEEEIRKKESKYKKRKIDIENWTLLVYVNFPWTGKINWEEIENGLKDINFSFKKIELMYCEIERVHIKTIA